ncbi:MAG: hypothetical protein K2Q22_02305 [Cytophagales bacterium]|nr:hypothetical protein [Cytophagales bacterium]
MELNKLFRINKLRNYHFSLKGLVDLFESKVYQIDGSDLISIKSLLNEAMNIKALVLENEFADISQNHLSMIDAIVNSRDKHLAHTNSDKYGFQTMHYIQNAFKLLEIAKEMFKILSSKSEMDLRLYMLPDNQVYFGREKLQEVADKFYGNPISNFK